MKISLLTLLICTTGSINALHSEGLAECTANIKSDAPAEFSLMNQYYDPIPFKARAFKNGTLYYLGPRFHWVPEDALRNLSEGCKYLREWNPGC